jgi:hypothetical protein
MHIRKVIGASDYYFCWVCGFSYSILLIMMACKSLLNSNNGNILPLRPGWSLICDKKWPKTFFCQFCLYVLLFCIQIQFMGLWTVSDYIMITPVLSYTLMTTNSYSMGLDSHSWIRPWSRRPTSGSNIFVLWLLIFMDLAYFRSKAQGVIRDSIYQKVNKIH